MNLRPAEGPDLPVLEAMLLEAVNWSPDRRPVTLEELRQDDRLIRYLEGWRRDGDAGVVAEDCARVVGAAWFRRFPAARPGFGFIDAFTPEVSMAVASDRRDRGVGSQLLAALIEVGRDRGVEALSLSVEPGNRAVRLYRRLGFMVASEDGGSCTMRLPLEPVRQ